MIPSHLLGVDNSVLVILPAVATLILIALWWRTESSLRRDHISDRKARRLERDWETKR